MEPIPRILTTPAEPGLPLLCVTIIEGDVVADPCQELPGSRSLREIDWPVPILGHTGRILSGKCKNSPGRVDLHVYRNRGL